MKPVVCVTVLGALLGTGSLHAQTTPVKAPVPVLSSVIAASNPAPAVTTPTATTPCELHVFPTADLSYSGPNYPVIPGLGVLGAAIAGGLEAAVLQPQGGSDTQMRSFLTPEVQVRLLKEAGLLALLKLPADTIIFAEKAIPDRDDIKNNPSIAEYFKSFDENLNHGKPLFPTNSKCYREIIILSVSIWNASLTNNYIYRKFDERDWQNASVAGDYLTSKPKGFPAKSADKMEIASSSLRSTFARNFTEWATKKVKI